MGTPENWHPGMQSPAGSIYAYTKTYERNTNRILNPTAYNNQSFNPTVVEYYNSSDNIIKLEYVMGGETWSQTISGTGSYGDQSVSYTVTRSPWEKV